MLIEATSTELRQRSVSSWHAPVSAACPPNNSPARMARELDPLATAKDGVADATEVGAVGAEAESVAIIFPDSRTKMRSCERRPALKTICEEGRPKQFHIHLSRNDGTC